MSNLIPLEEAARLLGLTVDKLNEMRSNSEIFGYKDGTSWKFKMQELERVADEFDITINVGAPEVVEKPVDAADDEFDISLDDDEMEFDLSDDGAGEIEVAAEPVAESAVPDDVDDVIDLDDGEDFEINIDDDEDDFDLSGDDEIELTSKPKAAAIDSDEDSADVINLDDSDDNLQSNKSDVVITEADPVVQSEPSDEAQEKFTFDDESAEEIDLVGDAVKEEVAVTDVDQHEIVDLDLDDESEMDIKLDDDSADDFDLPSEDVAKQEPEDLSFGSSDIRLAGEGDDDLGDSSDLLLDDEPSRGDPSTGRLLGGEDDDAGSADMLLSEDDLFEDDLEIQDSHEDSIDLSSDFEDSSDLIMDDSDSSAEVVGEDSGLLLEDSAEIDLSGSLMDLAGADDDEDDELIVLEDAAPNDAATDLADDDFNLTPLEEVTDEESSGSQIIALEDSELYSDESAATLLSPSDELEAEPMLTEDALDVGDFGAFEAGVPGMTPGMSMTPGIGGALPEQPYTVWQVVSLGLVLFLLGIGGVIGYDLARNLWLPEDQIISGGILRMVLNLVS